MQMGNAAAWLEALLGRNRWHNRSDLSDPLMMAAMRACTFDFEAAEDMCRRLLADGTRAGRARELLRANEHNRSSYLFGLMQPAAGRNGAEAVEARSGGHFSVQTDDKGLCVSGRLRDASPAVFVFLNELLLGTVRTDAPDPRARRGGATFTFRIGKQGLRLLPAAGARLAVSTGAMMLRHAGGRVHYRCEWPEAKGGLEEAILGGAILTLHGRIAPPAGEARIDLWLRTYDRLAAFMQARWSRPVFLYYGSLLGAVRESRVIAHDDDLDVAYFSDRRDAGEVKEEMLEIIASLIASDPAVSIRLTNFFFKFGTGRYAIDVFPTWHDGRYLFSPWATRIECEDGLLRDVVEWEFHGHRVMVPLRAEAFLEGKYGPGWRIPDPTYRPRALPRDQYPFRTIPFTEDDRAGIIARAEAFAGGRKIGTVEMSALSGGQG